MDAAMDVAMDVAIDVSWAGDELRSDDGDAGGWALPHRDDGAGGGGRECG